MQINNLLSTTAKPLATSLVNRVATLPTIKPQPTKDVHFFVALRELQEKTCSNVIKKLDLQTVKEADITKFLNNFKGENKKYAQELLFQSADNLSMQGVSNKIATRYTYSTAGAKIILGQDGEAISYLAKKKNFINSLNCFGIGSGVNARETVHIIGKIFSTPLSKMELFAISKFTDIKIPDVGLEHTLNFFDFAIDPSGQYAKEKASKIIERAKKHKASTYSKKEAICAAINEMGNQNISDINKLRKKRGLNNIEYINSSPIAKIESVPQLLEHLSPNSLTAEKVHQEFQNFDPQIMRNTDFLKLLTSENGFKFYTPQKTFEALKDISQKLKTQLKEDKIAPQNAYFITRSEPKSDRLMAYMFAKLGDFNQNHFLDIQKAEKLAKKDFFKDKAVIYLDDINGTGITTGKVEYEYKTPIQQSKAFYVAHLESTQRARNFINNSKLKHIFHNDNKSLLDVEHPIYKEIGNPEDFKDTAEDWNSFCHSASTQGFFFSLPDNLVNRIRAPLTRILRAAGIDIDG